MVDIDMEESQVPDPKYPQIAVNDIAGALRLQTAPEQIADRILAAIAVGILYPGDQLPPERELTAILDVSRTTLRLALGRLSALGVIETKRGRQGGTTVKEIRPRSLESGGMLRALGPIWEQLEAMLDYRNLIQQMIAKTAATRRVEGDVEKMNAALGDYIKASTAADSRRADHFLHEAIAAATRNAYLVRLNRDLATSANLGFSAHPYSSELKARALDQHVHLVKAIAEGDGEKAERVAGEHFVVTSTQPWRAALEEAMAHE